MCLVCMTLTFTVRQTTRILSNLRETGNIHLRVIIIGLVLKVMGLTESAST